MGITFSRIWERMVRHCCANVTKESFYGSQGVNIVSWLGPEVQDPDSWVTRALRGRISVAPYVRSYWLFSFRSVAFGFLPWCALECFLTSCLFLL